MLGLDCRLDRIQGRRTVFVFGNPIIKTLCATVGFSDVTSANVVGYSHGDLADGASCMITSQFLGIGNEGFYLKDFKPTGYQDNTYFRTEIYGTEGFIFLKLNLTGGREAAYEWLDSFDGENWEGGYWDGADDDEFIDAGDALWAGAPDLWDEAPVGAKYETESSGEVANKKLAVKLRAGGSIGIGNPTPVDVKLSDVKITGYENNTYFTTEIYGTEGFIAIEFTGTRGRKAAYEWLDSFDGENWEGGTWDGADEDTTLLAGQGLWVGAPDLWEEADPEKDAYWMVFPNPVAPATAD